MFFFTVLSTLSIKQPHSLLSTTKDAHIKTNQLSEEFYLPQYLRAFGQKGTYQYNIILHWKKSDLKLSSFSGAIMGVLESRQHKQLLSFDQALNLCLLYVLPPWLLPVEQDKRISFQIKMSVCKMYHWIQILSKTSDLQSC